MPSTAPVSLSIEKPFHEETITDTWKEAEGEADVLTNLPAEQWKEVVKVPIKGKDSDIATIHSIPVIVNGIHAKSLLLRMTIKLGISAEEFYRFLTSVEGYAFIDPDSNPKDFNKPIVGPFPYREDGLSHIQAEYARLDIGGIISPRDYVVFNAHDFTKFRWYCKSILLPEHFTGHSSYRILSGGKPGPAVRSSQGHCIRIAYYIFMEVQPATGEQANTHCTFMVHQWFDFQGWLRFASTAFNRSYMEKFIKRCNEKFPI